MLWYSTHWRPEAKPGKEQSEHGIRYALKTGAATYVIFDTFNQDNGQGAHLNGRIAAALIQRAAELLSVPLVIEKVDLPAVKA